MSVARVSEITATSSTSFDDALKEGVERASRTLRGVSGVWVKDQEALVTDGAITGYRVTMKVTFVLDD